MSFHDLASIGLRWANLVPTGLYTVLAAIIAWIGIRSQLTAHAERERIDRETNMRREVYLAAFEAVAKSGDFLTKCSDISLSNVEHQNLLKDYHSQLFKVWLVADMRTVRSLVAYNQKFLECMSQLLPERNQLMALKRQIELATQALIEYQNTSKQRFSDPAAINGELMAAFQGFVESSERRIRTDERTLRTMALSVLRKVAALQKEIAPLTTEAHIAARTELGFDINEEEFRKILNDSAMKSQDTVIEQINFYERQIQQSG